MHALNITAYTDASDLASPRNSSGIVEGAMYGNSWGKCYKYNIENLNIDGYARFNVPQSEFLAFDSQSDGGTILKFWQDGQEVGTLTNSPGSVFTKRFNAIGVYGVNNQLGFSFSRVIIGDIGDTVPIISQRPGAGQIQRVGIASDSDDRARTLWFSNTAFAAVGSTLNAVYLLFNLAQGERVVGGALTIATESPGTLEILASNLAPGNITLAPFNIVGGQQTGVYMLNDPTYSTAVGTERVVISRPSPAHGLYMGGTDSGGINIMLRVRGTGGAVRAGALSIFGTLQTSVM